MGKGAETTTKKKKKKGRPSLLDIQKRILKQQKLQETLTTGSPNSNNPPDATPPNPCRRSTRRNPSSSDGLSPSSEWISGADDDDDDDEDDDERVRKKRKPLFGLDSQGGPNCAPDSPFTGSAPHGTNSNPRSDNHGADPGSGKPSVGSEIPGEKVLKGTDTGGHGSVDVSGPTTPLPDKNLLVFILDRLQKKDTHGVFSEPVDPEELPDYHDIIKHPMDFGTVRKKLEEGAYGNLEEFEKDVFLICSNAMQYNSPDTIFFRQARSMHEIAKKDFENLRQDSEDSEPEQTKVVRRGRPPGSALKKLMKKSSADRTVPEVSSDTVLANGDNSFSSTPHNLRKGPETSVLQPADSIGNAPTRVFNRENQNTWFAEFDKEFPASVLRSVNKEGKKLSPSNECKRDTYKQQPTGREQSVLSTFESETKYLTVVDLHSQDHGYARSLARFAANLGPVVWRIASKKIQSILPNGTKYGPGWVGDDDISSRTHVPFSQRQYIIPPNPSPQMALNPATEDAESSRRLASRSKLTSPSNSAGDAMICSSGKMGTNLMQNTPCSNYIEPTNNFPQGSTVGSQAFNSSFRSNYVPSSERLSWNRPAQQQVEYKPNRGLMPPPPDSSTRVQVQGSPSSSLLISPPQQQPDLGLQL